MARILDYPEDLPRLDLFSKAECRVWYRLVRDGIDLEFEECGEVEAGRITEKEGEWDWFSEETSEVGVEYMFDMPWRRQQVEGLSYDFKLSQWALELGIAPYQPFLVSMLEPDYITSHTMEGTEYDVEFSMAVIAIQHWKPSAVRRAWERHLSTLQRWWAADVKEKKALAERQRSDTKEMFIHGNVYFGRGQSSYDDMEMPRGIRFTLCSKHTHSKNPPNGNWSAAHLVSGEDDNGEHEVALRHLAENVAKEGIPLTLDDLKKMDRRWS